MNRRDDWAAAIVLVLSLALMGRTAAGMPQRWPWIWAAGLSAVPFLLLLSPSVQSGARALVVRRPAWALAVPALVVLAGLAVAVPSGAVATWRLAAWPICVFGAVWAVGRGSAAFGGARLLAGALALGVLAGIWDRALKIPVPGNTPVGLTFFAAAGLALFLYSAVRPLGSLDVRLGLGGRDTVLALGAFAVVAAVAVPLGFAVDFVAFNPRLDDAGFALARLLGLVVFVGIPEELLFRGLVQEGLSRLRTPTFGWVTGSVIFGVAHVTKNTGLLASQHLEVLGVNVNWRYALLATLAGLAYGWVYRRTGKVAAAALTHGAVDWLWSGFFGR